MRTMNCRNVRREIEEVAPSDLLSASASEHLKNCTQCATFREERLKLREMLSSLGSVEAPGDFDFRLRARLANERRPGTQPFVMRNLSFGFRSVAAVAMLLLVGAALLFVNFRTPPSKSLSANETQPQATVAPQIPSGSHRDTVAGVTPVTQPVVIKDTRVDKPSTNRQFNRRSQLASVHSKTEMNAGVTTLEQGITPAKVFRPGDPRSSRSKLHINPLKFHSMMGGVVHEPSRCRRSVSGRNEACRRTSLLCWLRQEVTGRNTWVRFRETE